MHNIYKARISTIFFMLCILFLVITINLFIVQIGQYTFYANLADKQYNVTINDYQPRATIVDRNNKFLAMNKESFSAFILPKQLRNKDRTITFLHKHFPRACKRLEQTNKQFMFVKRTLTETQIALIKDNTKHDIKLLSEPNRFYPIVCTSQIVGKTNIDNKGQFGIELLYNKQLSGSPTIYNLEKDARLGSFYFSKKLKEQGNSVQTIQLTLDSTLQFLVYQELKECFDQYEANGASALILNPKTGEIIVMANVPCFNPNTTNFAITHTNNPIVCHSYELGSVMKVFTALAALEEEVVQTDEIIDCKNAKTAWIDGRKINTVKAHDKISFLEVVAYSNNIGIAQIAKRLDNKLFDHYQRLGFGKKINLPFPGEQAGFINPPINWSAQSIISLSYGYEIQATLLQLAKAFGIIANDGFDIQPYLVINDKTLRQAQGDRGKSKEKKQLYTKENIEIIKNILRHTTLRGTTRRARIAGYDVMCKTGTANVLVEGQYNQTKNRFTCAGIVQKGDYKRVIVVFVDQIKQAGKYASTVAAPLFEKIAQKMIIHDKVI